MESRIGANSMLIFLRNKGKLWKKKEAKLTTTTTTELDIRKRFSAPQVGDHELFTKQS